MIEISDFWYKVLGFAFDRSDWFAPQLAVDGRVPNLGGYDALVVVGKHLRDG